METFLPMLYFKATVAMFVDGSMQEINFELNTQKDIQVRLQKNVCPSSVRGDDQR